ncbi:MAG: spore photoproduct lyase [bacterium]|nr:spore photoproduct lyase [bacterium]
MTATPHFVPRQVLLEPDALGYPLGQELWDRFRAMGVPVAMLPPHRRIPVRRGLPARAAFLEAKRTLVVAVRRQLDFAGCRPSAHYQLPLASSCPGLCQYCYLFTTLGKRPYVRVYVNLEEILDRATALVDGRLPEETSFEGSATSDPVAIESYTGSLARAVEHFAGLPRASLRFATKYPPPRALLQARHRGRTRIRFSVNPPALVERFERGTPDLETRLRAARQAREAGYPIGFLVAPIMATEGWQDEYRQLIRSLAGSLGDHPGLTFELITHRFTARAKARIGELFPGAGLPMDEAEREFRWGQFGYGKYVYPGPLRREMGAVLEKAIAGSFPSATVLYTV